MMNVEGHRPISRSETVETLPVELQSTSEIQSSTRELIKEEKTELKRELGLLEGCAVILGSIIGSGIFISPKGVLSNTGSPGLSLIVWVVCGVLTMIGSICYAELGTMIPKSGGDYIYIYESFGSLHAFLFLWASNIIFIPTTNAIMSLTFANYVVQPLFPDCAIPETAIRLIAAVAICVLTFMNCWNVKATNQLQKLFMVTKIGALVMIIAAACFTIYNGKGQDFSNLFEGSSRDPGEIASSFYTGIFSYAGWNYLNCMTEELKDPFRNLPRAIFISLPLVTFIYVFTNIAYLVVLSPTEMLSSDAIAVTFSNEVMGPMANWIMPLLVAISAFGGLSVHIMTSSRICFVGARQGQFPDFLAMINVSCNTPITSLIFLGALSIAYLYTTDIFLLIEYASFVESLFVLVTISGLLYLRIKQPNRERPIRVHIVAPIIFLIVCGFLVFLPIYVKPFEVGMGLFITLTGIPAYLIFIHWQNKPRFFQKAVGKLTRTIQCITSSLREVKVE